MKLAFSLLLLAVAMATVAAVPRWSNVGYQGAGGHQGGGGGFQQGGGGFPQGGGGGFQQGGGGFQQGGGGHQGGYQSSGSFAGPGRVVSGGHDNSNEHGGGFDRSNEYSG